MFQELYDVAKHTPLTLAITPRGEKLHVMIIPRPPEGKTDAALSQPISALGTPAELDAELPAALLQYCQKVNDARTRIDLPIEALDGVTGKVKKKDTDAASNTKKTETSARTNAAKPPRPAKAAPSPKPATVKLPAVPSARAAGKPKPAKHPPLPASKPKIDKATKEQCLDDGRDYLLRIGAAKPSRVLFIRFAKSGRRYEKMWSSFADFIDAVRERLPGAAPAGETNGGDADTKAAETETPAAKIETSRTIADPAVAWPFPRVDATSNEPQRQVVTEDGTVIGSSNFRHAVGDAYDSVMHPNHRVVEITDKRIIIAPPAEETLPPRVTAPPPPPPAPPVIRTVSTTTGTLLGSTMKKLAVGDAYTHEEFGTYRVFQITDTKVIVDRQPDEPAADGADTRTADLVSQAVQERG